MRNAHHLVKRSIRVTVYLQLLHQMRKAFLRREFGTVKSAEVMEISEKMISVLMNQNMNHRDRYRFDF